MKKFFKDKYPHHYEIYKDKNEWPIKFSTVKNWAAHLRKTNMQSHRIKPRDWQPKPKERKNNKNYHKSVKKTPPPRPQRPTPYDFKYKLHDYEKYELALVCRRLKVHLQFGS